MTTPATTSQPGAALGPVTAQGNRDLAALLPHIEARVELLQRIHRVIDSQADPSMYEVMDGVVCRNHDYAKLVHRLVGGSFEYLKDTTNGAPLVLKHNYDDEAGNYYVYEAFGAYILPNGERVEGSGAFSSRDKFLGKAGGEYKETSQVDERSVRQAALTECFKKCVFTALGYGKTPVELFQKANIDTSKATKYQHGQGTRQGQAPQTVDEQTMRNEIRRMVVEMFNAGWQKKGASKPTRPEDVLKQATTNEKFAGWAGFEKISPNGLKPTFNEISRHYKEAGLDGGETPASTGNGAPPPPPTELM